ncbi:MAG TPA: XrtA system polysaccharide chain length determinant [Xanthomonadales bacterium]|nr:XrtA system polysaccharide chain length determinant [Xanthomonadales bacterium]
MQDEALPITQQLPIVAREARRRALPLTLLFGGLALLGLVGGMMMPKKYVSTTTVLVTEDNIIQPLMEGRAATTGVADRAAIAREVIFKRELLDDAMRVGGYDDPQLSPAARDREMELFRNRISVNSPRENLIEISYWDRSAEKAWRVTQRIADQFIAASRRAKQEESREAYEFIAKRVDEYHAKLTAAEDRLEKFRAENADARPGSQVDLNARISELRRANEAARVQLTELRSRYGSIQSQLSGESQLNAVATREGQYRVRLAELQGELDKLLLSYTESHPDVVRVRHQMEDLQSELVAEQDRAKARRATGAPGDVSDTLRVNPIYVELRTSQTQIGRDIAAAQSTVSMTEKLLEDSLERGNRIAASESKLAELTRDYDVNKELYQDLLRRRENARVSMNMDTEGRGLTFSIHEPARMPVRPSGLRFLHFAVAGMGLAVAIPAVLLFGLVRVDPRIRSPRELERLAGVPVLAVVPTYATRADRRRQVFRTALAAGVVVVVFATYAAFGLVRLLHA